MNTQASLRIKTFIVIAFTFLILTGSSYFFLTQFLVQRFKVLESKHLHENVGRALDGFENVIQQFETRALEWGVWDKTYSFMEVYDPTFTDTDLPLTELSSSIDVDTVVIVDKAGSSVWQQHLALETHEVTQAPQELLERFSSDSFYMKPSEGFGTYSGITLINNKPFMIAGSAIMNNERTLPSRGVFVFGKFLLPRHFEKISEVTHLSIDVFQWNDEVSTASLKGIKEELLKADDEFVEKVIDEDHIRGYGFIRSLEGSPLLLFQINSERALYREGKHTTETASFFVATGGVAFGVLILFLMESLVLQRLQRFCKEMGKVILNPDLSYRLPVSGSDEISHLSTVTNNLLAALEQGKKELEESHQQMVELARKAGMAEVATGVLHNVGNVLNSVNTTAGAITEKVRGSRGPYLYKVTELIKSHGQDLGTFFSKDERGVQLPAYLEKLADSLSEEQQALLADIERLQSRIDHIKEIVKSQQEFAGDSHVMQAVLLKEVVEEALSINVEAFGAQEVSVETEFVELPIIMTDKHKILQILINLITNATQAMESLPPEKKTLWVRIGHQNGEAIVSIKDSGEGIAPEHLTKVFSHGFTTRKSGHGFGLHSSVIAAKSIKGSLLAKSEGVGRGAEFVLTIPLIGAGGEA